MIPDPILIVDDEAEVRETLQESLLGQGYTVETVSSGEEALSRMEGRTYPVVVTDLNMPGGLTGLELIRAIQDRHPDTLCILITAYATLDTSIEALKLGAYDLIRKPFRLVEMEVVLNRALEHAALVRRLRGYQAELETRILSRTQELQNVHKEVLALCDLTLLAADADSDATAIAPFLDLLSARWGPQGIGCYRHEPSGSLPILAARGPRQLPAWLDRPPLGRIPSPGLGYAEEHLLPLGSAGWLYLGFEDRSSFSDADPEFCLLVRHMELALRVR